jgi:hypothetical protein
LASKDEKERKLRAALGGLVPRLPVEVKRERETHASLLLFRLLMAGLVAVGSWAFLAFFVVPGLAERRLARFPVEGGEVSVVYPARVWYGSPIEVTTHVTRTASWLTELTVEFQEPTGDLLGKNGPWFHHFDLAKGSTEDWTLELRLWKHWTSDFPYIFRSRRLYIELRGFLDSALRPTPDEVSIAVTPWITVFRAFFVAVMAILAFHPEKTLSVLSKRRNWPGDQIRKLFRRRT